MARTVPVAIRSAASRPRWLPALGFGAAHRPVEYLDKPHVRLDADSA